MSKYFIYCRKSSESEDRQALSIEAQVKELTQRYVEQERLEVVEILQESFSAKKPGRPVFNAMVKRIQKGEANGIIAWHPDRLARNSLDGGKIIYLLDNGKLQDLKFPTYNLENTPQGKFMLAVMFGQSKYYVDSLSENVKRGNRLKLNKGWLPGLPPLGYLNEPRDRTIVKDPERFNIVRKLWDLMLSGNYSVNKILITANEDLGLRTRRFRRSGGNKLTKSGLYSIFAKHFYYGLIERGGITCQGRHEPMITEEEFWRVQRLLGRHGRPRPKKHEFAFTGLMKCAECGCFVTAEEQYNRYGYHYIYYHCTKKRRQCSQRYVEIKQLERQIQEVLERISLPQNFIEWAFKYLDGLDVEESKLKKSASTSIEKEQKEVEKNIDNLTSMRIKDFITDEEYLIQRNKLFREKGALKLKLQKGVENQDWLEPIKECIIFANRARFWFTKGNLKQKRLVLTSIGSNFLLKDKKLNIQLLKPFSIIEGRLKNHSWSTLVHDVRTFFEEGGEESFIVRDNLAKLHEIQNEAEKAA
ncbi:MAG: recombinase family protein [Planctomycetota bacterium]|jgi:DNA invertase Pin-like site-specific DNA recombinase